MGFVYLINETDTDNYKIGATKGIIEERKRQLQTGNSNELEIISYFETNYPFKLEAMLHNYYKKYNMIGEWFMLENLNIKSFIELCEIYNNVITVLKKNNPFYK